MIMLKYASFKKLHAFVAESVNALVAAFYTSENGAIIKGLISHT